MFLRKKVLSSILAMSTLIVLTNASYGAVGLPQRMRIARETTLVISGGGGSHTSYVSAICLDPGRRSPNGRDRFDGASTNQSAGIVIRRRRSDGPWSQPVALSDVVGNEGWPSSVVFRGRPGPLGSGLPSGLDVETEIPRHASEYTFEITPDESGVAVVGPATESEQESPIHAKALLEKSLDRESFERFAKVSRFFRLMSPIGADYRTPTTALGQLLANATTKEMAIRLDILEQQAAKYLAKLKKGKSDKELLSYLTVANEREYTAEDVRVLSDFLPDASDEIVFSSADQFGNEVRAFLGMRNATMAEAQPFIRHFTDKVLTTQRLGYSIDDAIARVRDDYLPEDCYAVASSLGELEKDVLAEVPIPTKYKHKPVLL